MAQIRRGTIYESQDVQAIARRAGQLFGMDTDNGSNLRTLETATSELLNDSPNINIPNYRNPKIYDAIRQAKQEFETGTIEAKPITPAEQVGIVRAQIENLSKDSYFKQGGGLNLTPSGQNNALAQTEIKQTPPVLSSLASDISGTLASASGLTTTTPTQQSLLAEMQRIQEQANTQATGLKSLLGNKPKALDVSTITSQAMEALGLPADFTKQQFQSLQTTNAEVLELSKQLNQVDTEEQQSLARIESQPIPMENISNQQRQTQRDFAIKKSSIAADITAKNAYAEGLRGNFQLVNQIVDKAVSLATYAKTQEVADYKWMFDNYKDEFDSLTKREQNLYDNLLTSLEKQTTATQEDLKYKMKLYLDNKVAIPDMATLGNMTVEEVARYVSQNRPADTGIAGYIDLLKQGLINVENIPADVRNQVISQVSGEIRLPFNELQTRKEEIDKALAGGFTGSSVGELTQEIADSNLPPLDKTELEQYVKEKGPSNWFYRLIDTLNPFD